MNATTIQIPYEAHTLAALVVGAVTPLLGVSITLIALRLYTRVKSGVGIRVEDWLITAGAMLAATDWAVAMTVYSPSFSPAPADSVTRADYIRKAPLSVVSAVMSANCIPLIKISVAVMLFRILQSESLKRLLCFLGVLQVILAFYGTILQITRCIPISGLWDDTVKEKVCWSVAAFRISLITISVLTCATDVVFSLLPFTFIMHIRRPMKERVMVCLVMGVGLFASAASIAKTVVIYQYRDSDEEQALVSGLRVAFWSILEEQVGVIAACLPCLKSYFQRLLGRLGFAKAERTGSNEWYAMDVGGVLVQNRSGRRDSDTPRRTAKMDGVPSVDTSG